MTKGTNTLSKLFAALVMAGVASHSFAADTIKIGIAGPKTGPVAEYGTMQFNGAKMAIEQIDAPLGVDLLDRHLGTMQFNGAKMAIEQINAKGGVDGKKLEAVEYDDVCEPKQAVAVANKVVNDGVKYVIGHLCSSSAQPASDVYEDEGIIMVTPAATSPDITNRGYKLVFRTIGLDSAQGPAAGNYIADVAKPKTVAVIHDKQQYGEGIASAVKSTLEGKGIKVALFEGINPGDKDFSSLIAKLKQANVDFVYYGGYHPELGQILRQSKEKGLKARFMGPEGVGNDSISQIAGDASEGLLVTLPKSFDQDPANQALTKAFKDKKQDPSGPFVYPSYSAVQVIADGIAAAKSEDTDKVAAAIHAGTFKTPMGELSYDDKGDLKNFQFVVYEWHFGKPKTEAAK